MTILPEELSLHLSKMDTSAGTWRIAVANVTATQSGQNLFLKLILEQDIDEETLRARELSLVVPAAVIFDPETNAEVLDRIRGWIEKTEGDGFLDLVSPPVSSRHKSALSP